MGIVGNVDGWVDDVGRRGVIGWAHRVSEGLAEGGVTGGRMALKHAVRRFGKSLTLGLAFCIVFFGFVGFHALRHGRDLCYPPEYSVVSVSKGSVRSAPTGSNHLYKRRFPLL